MLWITRGELRDIAACVDPELAALVPSLTDEQLEAIASQVRERYFALWQPTLSVSVAPEDVLVRRAANRFGDTFRLRYTERPPAVLPDEVWTPVLELTRAQLLHGLEVSERRYHDEVAALADDELRELAPAAKQHVDPTVWPRTVVCALAHVLERPTPPLPTPLGSTRVERILHTIEDGAVWGWDEEGEFFSPSVHRLAGAPPDTDGLTVWSDLIHPDDYPAFAGAAPDETAEIEYRVLGLDGVTRCILDRTWVDRLPNGGVFVKGLAYDITQRRAAEEAFRCAHAELAEMHAALRDAHARIERLIETVDEVLWMATFDARDVANAEMYVSPSIERLLGAPAPADPQDVSAAWKAAVHPDDRHIAVVADRESVAGRDNAAEYRIVRATGETVWILDRRRASRLPDGRLQVCGSLADVTERRRMEEELLGRTQLREDVSENGGRRTRQRHLKVVRES